jgi:hypothetical protein
MWNWRKNHKKLKTKAWKPKHKKNKTKLWNKIVFQIDVEHIENNWGSIFIYTHLGT